MQGIRLVCPPYHQYHTVPLADAPPPLGTAAACHLTEPDCLPFLLAGATTHRPWIPLLVLAPPAVLDAVPSLQDLLDRMTIVPCTTPFPYTTPDFPSPEAILASSLQLRMTAGYSRAFRIRKELLNQLSESRVRGIPKI